MATRIPWFRDPAIMGMIAQKPQKMNTMVMPNNPMGVGPGGPAGVVAEGEYVIGKDATNKIGAANLDKMQEKVLGRPMKRGGEAIPGVMPAYGRADDGGYVTKGPMVKSYGLSIGSFADKYGATNTVERVSTTNNAVTSNSIRPYNASGGDTSNKDAFGNTTYNFKPAIGALSGEKPTTTTVNPTFTFDASTLAGPVTPAPEPSKPVVAASSYTAPVTPTAVTPAAPKLPSADEMARKQGMAGLQAVASGQSPLFRTLANLAQKQIATQGTMDQASLRQQMAQMGVTGGAANAMLADLGRSIGSQQATAAATTAVNAQKMAQEAMGEIATQGMEGMKFDYTKMSDAVNLAAQSGDYDSMASIARDVYGIDVNVDNLRSANSAGQFSSAMSGLNALALQDPSFNVNSTGAQLYLKQMWDSDPANKGKPMDAKWASDTAANIKNASNPFYRAMNAIPEDLARTTYGSDVIDSFNFNGQTGYKGFQAAMANFFSTGGLKFDANGNWSPTGLGNTNNPVYSMMNNISEKTAPQSILDQMSKTTPVNTVFTDSTTGDRYRFMRWDSSTNKPNYKTISDVGWNATSYEEAPATAYDNIKKDIEATGKISAANEDMLKYFADAGNVDAIKDLNKLYASSGQVLPQQYAVQLIQDNPSDENMSAFMKSAGISNAGPATLVSEIFYNAGSNGWNINDLGPLTPRMTDAALQEFSNGTKQYSKLLSTPEKTTLKTNADIEIARRKAFKENLIAQGLSKETVDKIYSKAFNA